MERIKLVALPFFLLLSLLLTSCAPSGAAVLDYEALPFTTRFSLSMDNVNFTGTLTAGALPDGEGIPRDILILFESPDSLCGISVERKDGKIALSLDDLTLFTDSSRWLEIAELFALRGSVSSAKKTTLGGTACTLLEVVAKNGEKYSVYIDSSGLPLRICGRLFEGDVTLDLITFKQDV